ncbi:biotin--[acetyl-CoA-carboxylase] ligase [bacterium]|nr:biotin--[acetyl-CoA-carboxylase] ligase [bacterium]
MSHTLLDQRKEREVGAPEQIVLHSLQENVGKFVSGTSLARKVSASRTGVWNIVQYLIDLGYGIEARTKRGYRLVSARNRLTPPELWGYLPLFFSRSVHCFNTLTSTHELARRLALEGAPEGTLVIAEYQSQGKGRSGRVWHAPLGHSLLLSVLVDFPEGFPLHQLPITLALASQRATGLSLAWPNDLVVGKKKAGGVLLTLLSGERSSKVIFSLGLNVWGDPNDYPMGLTGKVETMEHAGLVDGDSRVRPHLLGKWCNALLETLSELEDNPKAQLKAWQDALVGRGEKVRWIEQDGERREGLFLGGDEGGKGKVDVDGEIVSLSAVETPLFVRVG